MGGLQRRRVVCAVAGDSHHFTSALQGLHQALLVHRAGAGYDFELSGTFLQLGICHGGNLRAGGDVEAGVRSVIPQSCAAPYLFGGGGGVAGYNLHLYAGIQHRSDSGGNIFAHRVGDGGQAYEFQAVGLK